jgi:hypothetical protein
MHKFYLFVFLIVLPVISMADLDISGNQVRMIGNAKWSTTTFGKVAGVKWERAWLTKFSNKIFPLVYRGEVPVPLSQIELKSLLGKVRKSILLESVKILNATEGIGEEKVALNVGGAYLIQFKRQYVRLIMGLVQSGRTLIMVAVMFAPNDKVAAIQAKELMESFQFRGTQLFRVSVND